MNTQLFKNKSCIVVFSGGQDSTTCLHWALNHFKSVYPLFFDYGQKHLIEQKSAQKIARLNSLKLNVIKLNLFKQLGGNALTGKGIPIKTSKTQLPSTFVPGRNIMFLTAAAAFAWPLGITDIITGVCQTDYSGYPDCRRSTIKSLEKTLSLGMDFHFKIHTPLMNLTKSQSIDFAIKQNALSSLAWSHTCYNGVYPPCQKCPACILRKKGFTEAGVPDPIFNQK